MPWTTKDPRFQKALRLVARWSAKRPELADRLERALFLVDSVRPTVHPDRYEVTSSTGRVIYTVRIDRRYRTSACNCPDNAKGNHCKHRLAAALYELVTAQAS
jgi:hypothetical protein